MDQLKQITSCVLLIQPVRFGYNKETAFTNSFQNTPDCRSDSEVQREALIEFETLVEALLDNGINVFLYEDKLSPHTPDAIFPNNWLTFHHDGRMFAYPIATDNRRLERREDILKDFTDDYGYRLIDFTSYEREGKFLEGTGSMVLDHENKIIYAAMSPRTDSEVLDTFGIELGYEVVSFLADGKSGELIYHTNVMMSCGEGFMIIGDQTIREVDRKRVLDRITSTGKDIISLTNEQVYEHFAGNILQLENNDGQKVLIMSETAFDSLSDEQLEVMTRYNHRIVSVAIPTIEGVGGGSVRCMMCEVFLPDSGFG